MKKIIVMAISLCLLLSLTACSCGGCKSTPPTPEASYFLTDYKVKDVKEGVYELAEYSVKFKNNGVQQSNGMTANAVGILKTELTSVKSSEITNLSKNFDAEIDCYKLTIEYSLSGDYKYKTKTCEFNDSSFSTIWFLGVKDNLKPIKIVKTIKCTTPFVNYTTSQSNDIQFLKYDFEYTIDYSGKDAIVDFTDNSTEQNFNIKDKTIKNYFSNTFFENDLLYFYPRAFALNSNFSTTRQTITVDGKIDLSMSVSSFNADYKCKNLNGKEQNVKVDVVQYTNTGKYQSAPINVYFANVNDENCLFRAPVKIENYVTLAGTLEYDLTNYEHN